jgi:hypothetical protein
VVIVAFLASVFSTSAASSRNSKTVEGENSLGLPGSKPDKLIEDTSLTVRETQQALTKVTSEIALTRVE